MLRSVEKHILYPRIGSSGRHASSNRLQLVFNLIVAAPYSLCQRFGMREEITLTPNTLPFLERKVL